MTDFAPKDGLQARHGGARAVLASFTGQDPSNFRRFGMSNIMKREWIKCKNNSFIYFNYTFVLEKVYVCNNENIWNLRTQSHLQALSQALSELLVASFIWWKTPMDCRTNRSSENQSITTIGWESASARAVTGLPCCNVVWAFRWDSFFLICNS